jgi:hypothetical protein
MSACVEVKDALIERDTVAEEHQADYDKLREDLLLQGHVYYGFCYDRTHVWFKVHDGDTDEIIAEVKFKGSGKAMEFLLQGPGVSPEDLTLDGPVSKHS